ncbi:hypothetical protein H632_c79p0, partial [Helicosporidium sp. ATCC 50920]
PAKAAELLQASRDRDQAMGLVEAWGGGERHHVVLPSYPSYLAVPREEFVAGVQRALNKPVEEVQAEELTAGVLRKVLGAAVDVSQVEEELAAREDEGAVREFEAALAHNAGRSGRERRTPTRPSKGWPLLVVPKGRHAAREPYVALPGGRQRPLSDKEQRLRERAQPKPRRRVL